MILSASPLPRRSTRCSGSHCLTGGQVMVIPTEVKSPVGLMASLGRPTASCSVCVLQTEAARTVLVHAARNCLWTLKADLSKVAVSLGHMDHPKHLPELVPMLIRAILGDLPEAQMQEILALRGVAPVDPIEDIVDRRELESELTRDEAADLKEGGM